jgi:hypothetical protein
VLGLKGKAARCYESRALVRNTMLAVLADEEETSLGSSSLLNLLFFKKRNVSLVLPGLVSDFSLSFSHHF